MIGTHNMLHKQQQHNTASQQHTDFDLMLIDRQQQRLPPKRQPLRSGSIVSYNKPLRSVGQQMQHHLQQGIHRSINPLYPLPTLPEERRALLHSLPEKDQEELVRMIVERHQYSRKANNTVDMHIRALDIISGSGRRR
jgi:hypothetical protein